MKGVSRMAISKVAKTQLSEAFVGKKIDLDHPSVKKYMASTHGSGDSSEKTKKSQNKAKKSTPKPNPAPRAPKVRTPKKESNLSTEFEDMTLREIISRFGTSYQFKEFLSGWKTLADVRLKEIQIKEKSGELIPKEFVKTHVFAILDGLNKRLLMDTPKTIFAQVKAMIKSDAEEVATTKTIHDLISAQLKSVTKKVKRNLHG